VAGWGRGGRPEEAKASGSGKWTLGLRREGIGFRGPAKSSSCGLCTAWAWPVECGLSRPITYGTAQPAGLNFAKKKVVGLNAKGYVAKRANITRFNSIVFSVVGDVFIDNKVSLKDLSAQSSKMLIEIGFAFVRNECVL
jgi:hypothetical protein